MSDISIRIEGCAGRITLQRPDALNALTYDMVLAIEAALDDWRGADIDLVLLDAEGDRAFCSGGDIADMYKSGQEGDLDYGRRFWRDEYRLNAKIFEYPKPVVSFLQGFTMGGGVGVGCHGTHRIVGDSSQIAMPECGIGLVPDVGGSLMLALAPGRLGEYLGTTATRMGPADAIYAGFADAYLPEAEWGALKAQLVQTGEIPDLTAIPPEGTLQALRPQIDYHFSGETLADILRSLASEQTEFTAHALKAIGRNAPLAMACSVEITHRLRGARSIRQALDQEFRYTYRAVAQGDFIEGIRAAIIDRDRQPKWAHEGPDKVKDIEVAQMLLPLGSEALNWEDMP
ncbi:enoyl-CoA hydratase/carnithine racemase [Litoreibacter ponti]|uniref:3-hydroxyisobutyryl-CoA hydrolase n=1 Tax=Litoreibacter ponti TaxID=1510457 RepID=A0A2T6BI81_9RHOB|nr:enoyl-CoA hydratase/isomerase family protein [Litoreibacter ponti]PTX55770.1 enoyl-CoA hydratase/carnithine racemase [Litoreibacter ponti]